MHVMKESESNSKTQNKLESSSISDQTHGKNEPIVHEQSAGYKRNRKEMGEAKSMRTIKIKD